MAQSLESRGLGLAPRTVWQPIRVRAADVVFGVTVLICLGILIGAAGALGVLRGPGSLF